MSPNLTSRERRFCQTPNSNRQVCAAHWTPVFCLMERERGKTVREREIWPRGVPILFFVFLLSSYLYFHFLCPFLFRCFSLCPFLNPPFFLWPCPLLFSIRSVTHLYWFSICSFYPSFPFLGVSSQSFQFSIIVFQASSCFSGRATGKRVWYRWRRNPFFIGTFPELRLKGAITKQKLNWNGLFEAANAQKSKQFVWRRKQKTWRETQDQPKERSCQGVCAYLLTGPDSILIKSTKSTCVSKLWWRHT